MVICIIITMLIGIGVGAALVRYGIGLGTRIIYQVKEDMPILGSGDKMVTTDQVNTDGTTDEDLQTGEWDE